MFCSNCGKELPEDSQFCPNCGSPVGQAPAEPTKKDNDLGQTLDSLGESLGNEIDGAVDELKDEFKQAGKDFAEVSASLKERSEDIKSNWKDYLTPENMEKLAVIGLFLPLVFAAVKFVFGRLLWPLYFVPVIKLVYKLLYFLIKLIFVVASGASLGSIAYVIATKPEKRNLWSYISCGGNALSFIACLLMAFGKLKVVAFIFALAGIVWGVDALSRVLFQNKGVETEPNVGEDLQSYKAAYEKYKAEHPVEEVDTTSQEASYFDGDGLELLGLTILTSFLSMITCSIATPWMLCKIYKWRKTHTVINGRRLDFVGTGGSLIGHWILWTFLTIITCGIYSFFMYVALKKWELKNTVYADQPEVTGVFDGNSFQYFGYGLLQSLLLMLTCGLAAPWTITMIQKWMTRHESIGSDRMKYEGTAMGILGQYIIIALLTVITCGIYSSWGIVRMNKYIVAHTHVDR